MSNFTNTNFMGIPMPYTKPTRTITFEARIRDEWVCVEAQAWADQDGIYKQEIMGVYLDGVNVTGLLTDYDLAMLDGMIDDAIQADADSENGFNPEIDAFKLGE